MNELQGKVAIVTGAAQGIGHACAAALAAMGASVALVDLQAEAAQDAAARLRDTGARATGIGCDVASSDQVYNMVRTVEQTLGAALILVNAAGGILGSKRKPVEDVTDEEWHRVLTVNLTGSFYTARAVVPAMKAAGWGRIINISSGAGRSHSRTGVYAYTSSKAGVHGLTRQLAVDLGQFGITANAVAPGMITSPLGLSTMKERTEEQRQAVLNSIALRRMGDPSEIGDVVAFLASPAGGYISGQTIGVDGGHWMF